MDEHYNPEDETGFMGSRKCITCEKYFDVWADENPHASECSNCRRARERQFDDGDDYDGVHPYADGDMSHLEVMGLQF